MGTYTDVIHTFTGGKIRTKIYYTTVIAKIKEMPLSLFYVIPRFVSMDYEK